MLLFEFVFKNKAILISDGEENKYHLHLEMSHFICKLNMFGMLSYVLFKVFHRHLTCKENSSSFLKCKAHFFLKLNKDFYFFI